MDEHRTKSPVSVRAGVLVGGGSHRMGGPKPLLELAGEAFIERIVGRLAAVADEVVLLGEGPVPEGCRDLRRIPDPPGLRGPLAGILGALRSTTSCSWILAGCDQPMVSEEALEWLLDQRTPGKWAILPRLDERGVEPLLAWYDPRARSLLEPLAASGALAPSHLMGHARVHTPEPPAALADAWTNVNTPEDLDRLYDRRA
jgi:molybdopterin-guanine dinucleotide biosynthesis protein A